MRPVNAGESSLGDDPATDVYTYEWKTDNPWAGTCRRFDLDLVDGTRHSVTFEFRP